MLAALGILMLVAGATATFAIERAPEGVDLLVLGWSLMAIGGVAYFAALFREVLEVEAPTASTSRSSRPPPSPRPARERGRHDDRVGGRPVA